MKRRLGAGQFAGQKVLIVGLGLHGGGAATVTWLARHGATIRVTDLKTKKQLAPTLKRLPQLNVSWRLGGHHRRDVAWADWLVQNPGVADTNPLILAAKKQGKCIMNEASLFLSAVRGPVIGVTGTRGKTTTTLLIGHILSAYRPATQVAGNFRDIPMLSVVDQVPPRAWTVLELSSFQLEGLATIRRSPRIAVWTNVLVDHLNRYDSMADYIAAKREIVKYQKPGDIAVLNADSAAVRRIAQRMPAKPLWFSTQRAVGPWSMVLRDGWVKEVRGRRAVSIVTAKSLALPGEHQRHNLLAAVGAARAAGVPIATIRRAVKTFKPIAHRQELVRTWRGHDFINDTTATSPEGALAGLQTFPGAIYIMGGTDKRLNFSPLVTALVRLHPTIVWLPGSATEKILSQLRQKKFRGQSIMVKSMPVAVRQAQSLAAPGQTIVLTPGAASFGLFQHEFDRGEQFIRSVRALR